jgi:putative two-component system response regulator
MEPAVKILIVDDDPTSIEMVVLSLSVKPGYRLFRASNAADGMSIAEEERPSLIISDRHMPDEDGVAFCRRIRASKELSDTMFMLLTGASEAEHKMSGLDAGADDYLTKPIDPGVLASKVKALLRVRTLQDELKREKNELERLNQVLNSSLEGVVTLLVNIIGLRVPDANGRAQRACVLSRWVGERMGLDGPAMGFLDLAARLFEIGKIVMPDELLKKQRKDLTADEMETLRQFPVFGQMLVASTPDLKGIEKIIRHQLENYDGTGMPDRLMREEIPAGSRILRVVNYISEIDDDGPLDTKEKIAALHGAQGTILDPRIVQLAEEYLRVAASPSWLEGKKEIALSELEEGMMIAADLATGSGMKLLPKDTRLTDTHVKRIFSHHRTDPIITRVYIYNPG